MSNNASDKKARSRTPDPSAANGMPAAQTPAALASNAVNAAPNGAENGKTRLPNVGDAPKFVAPSHGGVDILKLLTELEDQVENTRKMPFGGMIGFDEDKFHMTIMKIRANLPEEMKRASKLARDQERIVEETLENAERIKEDARKAALLEMEQGKKEAAALSEQARSEAAAVREQARTETDRQRSQAGSALADAQSAAQREAQHILEEAQAQGKQMVAAARQEAAHLVSDNEIVQQAMVMAQDLQMRAQTEAQAVRRGADEYARDVLINLENVLGKATVQVQRGRELLEKPR